MNWRKFIATIIFFAFVLAATACAAVSPTSAPTATSVPPTLAPTTTVPPTTAPTLAPTATTTSVTVTDSANRTVTIAGTPQRIVSLAPSTTEIAFALGLGCRVVAVDTYSDYPAEAKALPHFKTYPLNLEQLVSFKPDLVLAGGITQPDEIKKMEELKLTVLVVGVTDTMFEHVFADIAVVGKATGTQAKAEQVVGSMKHKVEAIKAQVANAKAKPRVYWELDATDAAKPFTPGPGSFINDIIVLAGGVNVAGNAKSTWAEINAEEVVAANPDVIILSDVAYGITVESVKSRKGWTVINAVKANKVFPIEDSLVSRPGPRVVDGLAAAAKLIHPELFQ